METAGFLGGQTIEQPVNDYSLWKLGRHVTFYPGSIEQEEKEKEKEKVQKPHRVISCNLVTTTKQTMDG